MRINPVESIGAVYLRCAISKQRRTMENVIGVNMKCPFCGYVWTGRVLHPKQCPVCKRYLKQKEEKNGKDSTSAVSECGVITGT